LIFLLDTNAAIAFINNDRNVRARFSAAEFNDDKPAISTIVLFELWYGVSNSKRWEGNARALRSFLDHPIPVMPFDADDSRAAGELRVSLESAGAPIGAYDLLIAAHAVRRGATLVTANTREFSRVPGLALEDWSA
jgi:tRNA(fMet)-specific endonuclease VapC